MKRDREEAAASGSGAAVRLKCGCVVARYPRNCRSPLCSHTSPHPQASPERAGKARSRSYVNLTSHPAVGGESKPLPIKWGAATAAERGPIVATQTSGRNSIGAHGGSYSIYRALAVATGTLDPNYVPDWTNTHPVVTVGPFPSWSKLATIDPFGHMVQEVFMGADSAYRAAGTDARPTIAVTKAHIELAEVKMAMDAGRLVPDGRVLLKTGQVWILFRSPLASFYYFHLWYD